MPLSIFDNLGMFGFLGMFDFGNMLFALHFYTIVCQSYYSLYMGKTEVYRTFQISDFNILKASIHPIIYPLFTYQFNTTSRYLYDILNINNVYFDNMVSQIYPSELQLNKANTSDTEAAFLNLHLSISNDIVSTKIYDKRDDFDFEIVNFPFLDGDVPRFTSHGVYISQLIRFSRASSYVAVFNTRKNCSLRNFLNKAIGIINFAKRFLNFIDDNMIGFLNSKLDLNLSCAKDFRNLISMVTWCIN